MAQTIGAGGRLPTDDGGGIPRITYTPQMETSTEEVLHELRSSLAGVTCAVQVLLASSPDPSVGEASLAGMLESELGRLERLLDGSVDPGDRPERVDELIDPVVTVRRLAGQQISIDGDPCWVAAGGDALAMVTNLLLTNAATHASGAPVHITVRHVAGRVRITIGDEGPGIPRQLRRSVFETGVSRAGSPGQGMGLALARRLVEGLGGRLALDDTHRGAVFTIDLPAVPEAVCA